MATRKRAPSDARAIENLRVHDVDDKSVRLGSLWEDGPALLIGPKSVMKGLARGASGVGVGRVIGDVQQLGGTFIVDENGAFLWSHVQQDASDNPSVEELLEALKESLA